MANRRMISSDIFEDEFIGRLDYFGRLLWIGLISSVADDQGRMIDNPALIRSRVFLYDNDIHDEQVENLVSTLHQAGKIVRYVVGNKQLIQIVKWWKYQTPAWAMPSKYPAPIGWQDRAKYHTTGNKVIVLDWDKEGGYIANYIPPVHSLIEDGDGDGEGEGEGNEIPLPPNVFELYENEIGSLSKVISDKLTIIEQDYPNTWIVEAITEASTHNARNLAYVEAILKRRKADGGKGKSNGNGHVFAETY